MRALNQKGFAFPAVLLAMTVLLTLTTAGFFSANQEAKVGIAAKQSSKAFYLAELGLSEVMESWSNASFAALPQWDSVTFADTLANGIWEVTVTKANDKVYYLDSSGLVTAGGALAGATRRLGMVTRMTLPDFDPRAALTTRNNVSVRGRAEVHGEDTNPPNWGSVCTGTLSDKAGVLLDDTTQIGKSGKGKLTGAPPIAEDTTINASTFTDFGDLHWNELIQMASKVYAGGSLNQFLPRLDGSGNCDPTHTLNWGDPVNPAGPCGNYFPIIYIQGNANLQSGTRGQGILLVDGSLDVRGDFIFHGLIITQGDFNAQGAGNRVYGAVMASNVDFDLQKGVGASVLDYSSCAIERAIINSSDLNRPRPLGERGWIDGVLIPTT